MTQQRSKLEKSLAVVAAFALVLVAVEPLLRRLVERYTRNEDFLLFSIQNARAADPDDRADVLFLGDSTLRSSLIPKTFEAATGQRAMNLATVSNAGLMSDLFLLERYLEHHPPPKVVVLSHALGVFQVDLHEHLYQVHFADLQSTARLASAGLLPPLSAIDALLASSLASYRHRPYLRTLFDGLLVGDLQSLRIGAIENAKFRASRRELGWYPDERQFSPAPGARPVETNAPFFVSRSADWFIERLITRAEEQHFRLVWAHGALYAGTVGPLEDAGFLGAHRRRLAALADAHPAVFLVLDDEMPLFGAEALATINHPRPETAERLTRHWAERLRPLLESR